MESRKNLPRLTGVRYFNTMCFLLYHTVCTLPVVPFCIETATRCLTWTRDRNIIFSEPNANPYQEAEDQFLFGGWTVRDLRVSWWFLHLCILQAAFNLLVRDCGRGNSHLSLRAAGREFPQAPCPRKSGEFLPADAGSRCQPTNPPVAV